MIFWRRTPLPTAAYNLPASVSYQFSIHFSIQCSVCVNSLWFKKFYVASIIRCETMKGMKLFLKQPLYNLWDVNFN